MLTKEKIWQINAKQYFINEAISTLIFYFGPLALQCAANEYGEGIGARYYKTFSHNNAELFARAHDGDLEAAEELRADFYDGFGFIANDPAHYDYAEGRPVIAFEFYETTRAEVEKRLIPVS